MLLDRQLLKIEMEVDERLRWLEARISSSLRPRGDELRNLFTDEENRCVEAVIDRKPINLSPAFAELHFWHFATTVNLGIFSCT